MINIFIQTKMDRFGGGTPLAEAILEVIYCFLNSSCKFSNKISLHGPKLIRVPYGKGLRIHIRM
jgi:hypothetical protein